MRLTFLGRRPRSSAGQVVQAHLEAFSAGDLRAMLATMAPDAVFVTGTTLVAPHDFEEFFGRAIRDLVLDGACGFADISSLRLSRFDRLEPSWRELQGWQALTLPESAA